MLDSEDEDAGRSVRAGERSVRAGENALTKVIHEGWMARCRRRKICRSGIHMRYFILESGILSYYKKRPQSNEVPVKTIRIDGNCKVEDRGLKVHHGQYLKGVKDWIKAQCPTTKVVYSLSVYNKKEKPHRMTTIFFCNQMASFNIQDAQMWKEKIEFVVDQSSSIDTGANSSVFDVKSTIDSVLVASSSDPESQ
ncbi:hypothetical protein ACLOJK_039894 [Asimina triloba]